MPSYIPETQENEIEDLGSLHHYRTEIPNIIYKMKLGHMLFTTYCVLKMTAGDKGVCFKSNATLAEEVGVSIPTLIKLKEQLHEKKLIKIIKRKHEKGGLMPDLIQIVNIWPQNMKYMSEFSTKKKDSNIYGDCKPGLLPLVKPVNQGSKASLHKQEHKEEEQKEQQQAAPAAAVFSEPKKKKQSSGISGQLDKSSVKKPKPSLANPAVYECLKGLDISLKEQAQITASYEEETVKSAVAWATHPQTVLTKGMSPALKWACQNNPKVPQNKEEVAEDNRKYAEKYDGMKNKVAKIECCSKHVEIVHGGASAAGVFIKYDDKSFLEKFMEALKVNKFRILE
jgi:hypothetical protein